MATMVERKCQCCKMTKAERAANANRFIDAVASCGRKFFLHKGYASRFMVDTRGKVWFVDAYSGKQIYTHWERGQWAYAICGF